jgi:hypothetical protein
MRRAESGVPSCTFGGLQAQMATLYGTDSHNGPRRFVNWRNIAITLIEPCRTFFLAALGNPPPIDPRNFKRNRVAWGRR